ncbi:hypothetical protein TGMAS_279315 [Toxoplasma gondii MAS]|uniref:Uncharacterized protein n=2 Tax=Toxoplasma gondii TaxID=5811 RepID=A0A2G8Y5A9_TOXGO|nr:hypothetical protein TGMAS_279315 [Toxoplasma gondii MAS]PIM02199.1 hypothetical protein TGCOUG_279315 [Toxoplasma gondii COUG]
MRSAKMSRVAFATGGSFEIVHIRFLSPHFDFVGALLCCIWFNLRRPIVFVSARRRLRRDAKSRSCLEPSLDMGGSKRATLASQLASTSVEPRPCVVSNEESRSLQFRATGFGRVNVREPRLFSGLLSPFSARRLRTKKVESSRFVSEKVPRGCGNTPASRREEDRSRHRVFFVLAVTLSI